MLSNMIREPLCSHRLQANGIHTFVFQESSRAAVNQWIDYMDDVLGTAQLDVVLPIALDTRFSGMLPLAYMLKQLRDLFANYDKRPPIRIGLISNQGALMLLVQMLAQITASDDKNIVEYHQSAEETEAAQWLLCVN